MQGKEIEDTEEPRIMLKIRGSVISLHNLYTVQLRYRHVVTEDENSNEEIENCICDL